MEFVFCSLYHFICSLAVLNIREQPLFKYISISGLLNLVLNIPCLAHFDFLIMNSLFNLKSMAIPALLWILPEECDQLGGEHLCDHKVVVATYSFLCSSLIEIFYVSVA
jgi:hypothetical protein